MKPVARIALGLGVLVLTSPTTRADALADTIAAALARVATPADAVREGRTLAELGPAAFAPLFDEFVRVPPDSPRSFALLAALGAHPRGELCAWLARFARTSPDEPARRAALGLLGRVGGRDELALALELAAFGDPRAPLPPALRAAFQAALLGLAARERGAARACGVLFSRAQPALRPTLVRTIAASGRDEAAALLADLLGVGGPEADALVLHELARLPQHGFSGTDELAFERVRGLLGHPDGRLARLAVGALVALRDHGAVPDLIVLLGDDDADLRARAHAALTTLTGLALPAEDGPWIAWLAEALAWWEERAEPCRVALVSGAPSEAAAAIREVAAQRLYLARVAELLALALERRERDLVASACRALGAVPEAPARAALQRFLAQPDPELAAWARAALERHERARPRGPVPRLPLQRRTP
jgi:hypothetical protein